MGAELGGGAGTRRVFPPVHERGRWGRFQTGGGAGGPDGRYPPGGADQVAEDQQ